MITPANIYLIFKGNCEEVFIIPSQTTSWDDYFGMYNDKSGINRMISFAMPQH